MARLPAGAAGALLSRRRGMKSASSSSFAASSPTGRPSSARPASSRPSVPTCCRTTSAACWGVPLQPALPRRSGQLLHPDADALHSLPPGLPARHERRRLPAHPAPMGFDLMAVASRRGDRSRRDDDRYLFLEALLSAQQGSTSAIRGSAPRTTARRCPPCCWRSSSTTCARASCWRG